MAGMMKSAACLLFPLLLIQCAMNARSVPIYIGGKRMALFEVKNGLLGATVYDAGGDRIYYSDFIGGCKNIPQAGTERIGTRFKYDKHGNFLSKWDINADSSLAIYTERLNFGKSIESAKYIYRDGNLDSIIYMDDSMRVSQVSDFGGKVCINFSESYIAYLNGYFLGYDQGSPYLYDTLFQEIFDPKTANLSTRIVRTPDSTIETSFFKSGRLSRKLQCRVSSNEHCKTNVLNEWFENGKPSAEEGPVGSHIVHRHYYENGNLMTESFYKGTKLDSVYKSWHENGKLNQRIAYDMGRETKVEEWDEKGKQTK
jgi:hypothetical protein